jgi:hypothetical protein
MNVVVDAVLVDATVVVVVVVVENNIHFDVVDGKQDTTKLIL